MNTIYYPAAADKTAGFVNLYLSVTPMLPCTSVVSDARHIQFDPCNGIPSREETSITIQPNPSNGFFTLIISGKSNIDMTISVVDITGKKKFGEEINTGSVPLKKVINLTGSASGIYMLKCETEGKVITKKLVIH